MSLVELVQVRTADGVRLDGAIALPKRSDTGHAHQTHTADPQRTTPVDAVLAVHGTGSNFYGSTLFDGLTPKLLADGLAVLRVNTRGHDIVSTAATLHGPLRLGSALETVDECRHDLIAWLEFLSSRGYRSIALLGHSLGATKAVYTITRTTHPALSRLIAISPPRLSHSHFLESEKRDDFLAQFRQAKEHMAAGHGETLMEIRTPLPFLVSAASFIDKYGPEEKYNILNEIGRLNVPTLFVYGEVELAEVAFRGLPEAISAAVPPGAAEKISVITIAGANHVYTGQIDELSHKIRAWLAKS